MKTDNNPSILFGLYSKPDKKTELLEELKKLGVGVREISFIDVEIPLERKDEIINFFKHFVNCDYWAGRNPLLKDLKFFGVDLKKIACSKLGLKPVEFTFKDWKPDNRHPLLWTLAVPLLYQDTSEFTTSEEEKKKIEEIGKFQSKDYKPVIEDVVNPQEMEMLK
jgi:hypothetical protein